MKYQYAHRIAENCWPILETSGMLHLLKFKHSLIFLWQSIQKQQDNPLKSHTIIDRHLSDPTRIM